MAISKSNFKFYLTSLEPGVEQTIHSQSLGGYPAVVVTDLTRSLVYPEASLASGMGLYDSSLTVALQTPISGREYLGINDEVIRTEVVAGNTTQVLTRAINNARSTHISGDIVRGLARSSLFNNNFNDSFKQYRCIAVRNNGSDIAYNVEAYLKHQSGNAGSKVKLAVEIPASDYYSGAVTSSVSKRQLTVLALTGAFANNHFASAYIRFTSGSNVNQARIVSSFDAATGTLVVDSDFPFTPAFGDAFEIDPAPSQRIVSGIVSPTFGSGRVSELSTSAVNINVNGGRDHGLQFQPKDVFYVWLERTLNKDAISMDANSVVISLRYSVS
jgi:hypothetical protein